MMYTYPVVRRFYMISFSSLVVLHLDSVSGSPSRSRTAVCTLQAVSTKQKLTPSLPLLGIQSVFPCSVRLLVQTAKNKVAVSCTAPTVQQQYLSGTRYISCRFQNGPTACKVQKRVSPCHAFCSTSRVTMAVPLSVTVELVRPCLSLRASTIWLVKEPCRHQSSFWVVVL